MMFERAQGVSSCLQHAKAVWVERSTATRSAQRCFAASATKKEKGQKRVIQKVEVHEHNNNNNIISTSSIFFKTDSKALAEKSK